MPTDFDALLAKSQEIGYVEKVGGSLVSVEGLPGVRLGEMVAFEQGQIGQVMSLRSNLVEVLLMGQSDIKVGTKVARLGKKTAINIGEGLLGKTINVLGVEVHTGKTIESQELKAIDQNPTGLMRRRKIDQALNTGIMLVDMMIPLGKGQRELVIGDRKTGKSYFLLQTILSQARNGTICVYAAIGKKKTEIMKVEEFFKTAGISQNTVIVAASSQDSDGEIFACPYTAMTVAEYFRDKGKDVLVVLDDMTTHAKFYRQLALMARRFPGRDSYPGDIFHIHSKLLERAGNFAGDERNISITCLPVADTVAGDISGYIQTNLMSMTDGHIYFDGELFLKGRRPAINPFISVTRVGRQTQTGLARDAGRMLFSMMNNYEKTQSFLKFGAELGENSRQVLAMGEKILAFFDQPINVVMPPNVGLVLLAMLFSGQWNGSGGVGMVEKYRTEKAFAEEVNEIVKGCDTMNKLMEACRTKAEAWQGVMQ